MPPELYRWLNWRAPAIRLGLAASGSSILRTLEAIRRLERLSPERLRELQEKKLRKLLLHAHEKVPYYRDVLSASGVVQGKEVNLPGWASIPVLTKTIVREQFERLKSEDLGNRKWFVNHSGGSTGEPVTIIQDADYRDWNFANKLYYRDFGGQQLGWPEVRFWSSERDILQRHEKLSVRLRDWVLNRRDFNSFRMTQPDMHEFARVWNRVRPTWIEGYAISLDEFARFIRHNGIDLNPPLGVVATAETLIPEMQRSIEATFRAPVFNRYGSREVGDIACSCYKGSGLHISVWNNYIEILDQDLRPVPPGQSGSVFVTNLNNHAMPLIRYQIGDVAAPASASPCPCGRNTPRLERVEGRVVSVFKTRDETFVSGGYFIHLIGSVCNRGLIEKFQVVQKDYDTIEIRIVTRDAHAFAKDQVLIDTRIRAVMGQTCQVEWLLVEDIPPLPSGKYEFTRTEIE